MTLALGVLVGPVVALANQQVIYASDSWACGHNAHAVLHVIPIVALAIIIAAGLMPVAGWRAAGRGVEDERGGVDSRTRFLALMGIGISTISALVVVAQWASIFTFGSCMRA
ncbi:MAG TPA: hypothetical protein VN600_02120 [Gemmatimonadaceae bacterium]|nr:hypothetical protein [Gemmatimonadaceae bacterium]